MTLGITTEMKEKPTLVIFGDIPVIKPYILLATKLTDNVIDDDVYAFGKRITKTLKYGPPTFRLEAIMWQRQRRSMGKGANT